MCERVRRSLTNLCVMAAADSGLPVRHVNAVGVTEQPVVLFNQEGSGILADRAVDIVEDGRLVPVHLHLIKPGTRLPEKHPRRDLQRRDAVKGIHLYSGSEYLVRNVCMHEKLFDTAWGF